MNWTVISGTNRNNSKTLQLATFTQKKLKEKLGSQHQVNLLDLTKLPPEIFHPDVYAKKPESFKSFEDLILNSNAILSILPEYNGSAPGVFKYFIDMLPFPKSLHHIPCSFMGLSAGRFGAVRSVEHMEQVFQYRNAYLFPGRIFIPLVEKNLGAEGNPTDDFVAKLYDQYIDEFIEFSKTLNPLSISKR